MELIRDLRIAVDAEDPASVRRFAQHSFRERKGLGEHAKSFHELSRSVAALRVALPYWRLVFRGQPKDYSTRYGQLTGTGKTTLHPSILRTDPFDGGTPNDSTYRARKEELKKAESMLLEMSSKRLFGEKGIELLGRYRCLRWALLQHYGICRTPLLDVTSSLLVAASFAAPDDTVHNSAFVFVLAIPWGMGAVQTSAEDGIQAVDLTLLCPPQAHRPHIQESLLLGEYPELTTFKLAELRAYSNGGSHHSFDFARRLVAKFWIDPRQFWEKSFVSPLPHEFLFPKDPVRHLACEVKATV
jgi:hypothetical protein